MDEDTSDKDRARHSSLSKREIREYRNIARYFESEVDFDGSSIFGYRQIVHSNSRGIIERSNLKWPYPLRRLRKPEACVPFSEFPFANDPSFSGFSDYDFDSDGRESADSISSAFSDVSSVGTSGQTSDDDGPSVRSRASSVTSENIDDIEDEPGSLTTEGFTQLQDINLEQGQDNDDSLGIAKEAIEPFEQKGNLENYESASPDVLLSVKSSPRSVKSERSVARKSPSTVFSVRQPATEGVTENMSDLGDDGSGSPLEEENYSSVMHSGEVTLKSFYIDPSLPQEKLDPFSSLEDEIESLYAVNFAKKKISENTEMDLFQGCYISEEVCSQLREILTAAEVYRQTHAEECEHMRSFDHNSIMELASVKTSIPTKVLQRAKSRLQKLYTLPRIRRDEVASQLGILIELLQMNPPILIDHTTDHHIPEKELRLDSQSLSAEFSTLDRRQLTQGEHRTTRLLRQRFLRSDYKNTDFRHPATTSELCVLMNDSIISIPPALLSVFDGSVKLLAETIQRLSLPGNIQGYDRIKADEVGVITVSDIYRPINDITDFVSPIDYLPRSVTSLVPTAPADLVARLNKDVPLPRHRFNDDFLQCYWCLSTQPQWRPGPNNVRLCNSCGLRYASTVKRDLETELRNVGRLKNWVEELEKNRRDMGAGRPRTEAQKKSVMRRRPWNVVDNLVTAYAMLNVESDKIPASHPFYDPSLFRLIPRDLLVNNKDSTLSRPSAANLNDITSDTFSLSSPSTLSSPSSSTTVPAMSSSRLPNACEWCGTVYSRTWRKGPTGERSLCGGCGLVYENRVLNANADSRKRKRDRDRQGEDEDEEDSDTDSSALDGTEGSSDESQSEVESVETRSSFGKPFRKRLKYLSKEIIDDSDEDM